MRAAPAELPSVLFVCVKNAGKSQMAGALMRLEAGGRVEVHTAGTQPGSFLNAQSVEALAEVGAPLGGERPKPVDPVLVARVDRVIVLGSEATVDPVPGMRAIVESWETDEPSTRGIDGIERMRLVRDDIRERVRGLLSELDAPGVQP